MDGWADRGDVYGIVIHGQPRLPRPGDGHQAGRPELLRAADAGGRCGRQMRAADAGVLGLEVFPVSWADAQARHQGLYTDRVRDLQRE